ncbi:MAG: GTP-binding protein [Veillonella parvula]
MIWNTTEAIKGRISDSRKFRNEAIDAHVDHGRNYFGGRVIKAKATWFVEMKEAAERATDSNDLERERGITILSKNTAVMHDGIKINIVDTPGHADFGGKKRNAYLTWLMAYCFS